MRGHGASVSSVDFTADGRRVLTTSSDSTARIWDVETGREQVRLEGHEAAVSGGEFSPDGALIITFSIDRTARLWSGRDGKPLCTLAQDEAEITSAGFSPDGRVVIVSFRGRTVFTRTWPVDFLSAAHTGAPRADRRGTGTLRADGALIHVRKDYLLANMMESVRRVLPMHEANAWDQYILRWSSPTRSGRRPKHHPRTTDAWRAYARAALLGDAGFRTARVVPTATKDSVIEAIPG